MHFNFILKYDKLNEKTRKVWTKNYGRSEFVDWL